MQQEAYSTVSPWPVHTRMQGRCEWTISDGGWFTRRSRFNQLGSPMKERTEYQLQTPRGLRHLLSDGSSLVQPADVVRVTWSTIVVPGD